MTETIPFAEIEYGFQYGAAKVERVCSDKTAGWVVLQLETPRASVQVYVTRTGKIRLYPRGFALVCNE